MSGTLDGPNVIIEESREANRVYNKGYPGHPLSGGGLMLSLVEAAFLMDERGLEIRGIKGLVELFDYGGRYIHEFEVNYLVYRELRLRGFIVRVPDSHFEPSEKGDKILRNEPFHVLPRGATGPGVPAFTRVLPLSERGAFNAERMMEYCEESGRRGLESLLGLVDEDGDVTFYSAGIVSPEGNCEPVEGINLSGVLVHNRVVSDLNEGARTLHSRYFFGRPLGSLLHLSLIEAGYLMEKGVMEIQGLGLKEFLERAQEIQGDFNARYSAYSALRERGLRVKTGFKYGTHFRAYTSDPDLSHAEFLVHIDSGEKDWQEVSRGIRVAHAVKKHALFSLPHRTEEFLELAWVKP